MRKPNVVTIYFLLILIINIIGSQYLIIGYLRQLLLYFFIPSLLDNVLGHYWSLKQWDFIFLDTISR
jgi:hypothetical protein